MDPQERLFLETCWEALEDAGHTPQSVVAAAGRSGRRPVGVFVGVMHKDYALVAHEAMTRGQMLPLSLSNAAIANRVSYVCNFHGPSLVVDTVCSSSLVALHLAVQSLRSRRLRGGPRGRRQSVTVHPNKYLTYGLMATSHASDGRCRTFGQGGDGYVSGEGVGAVLLKPLAAALADGDHVYAVIHGTGINHGGADQRVHRAQPRGPGSELIRAALEAERPCAHVELRRGPRHRDRCSAIRSRSPG